MASKRPPLVIAHGSCRDGFCAAWVVRRKFPDAEIHFAYYGKEPPDVTDRDVVMVDFSYSREVMLRLADLAASLVVLDHHRTAQQALDGFETEVRAIYPYAKADTYRVIFDMERSGAGIAWDYFFPGEGRPWLVDYVEDRDLWRHRLPDSEAINAYIGLMPFDYQHWTDTNAEFLPINIADRGTLIRKKVAQYIAEASKNLRWATVAGYRVPVVNAPQVDISELLDAILLRATREHDPPPAFAVGWWQRFDGLFKFSLRSRGSFDVAELATTFGGGGHRAAAGFQSATLPPWITGGADGR